MAKVLPPSPDDIINEILDYLDTSKPNARVIIYTDTHKLTVIRAISPLHPKGVKAYTVSQLTDGLLDRTQALCSRNFILHDETSLLRNHLLNSEKLNIYGRDGLLSQGGANTTVIF